MNPSNESKEEWFSKLAKQYLEYWFLTLLYLLKVTNEFSALQLQDKHNTIKSKQDRPPRLWHIVIIFSVLRSIRPAVNELAKTLVEFSQNATGARWESKPFNRAGIETSP